MSLLTIEKSIIYDSMCLNLLNDKKIKFAGMVNNKGRMITGLFEKFPDCFDTDKEFEMFLMETALEFSMKRDFDTKFGRIESVFSKRGWANVMCIPIIDDVLIVITHSEMESHTIIKKCTPILESRTMVS